MGISQDVIIIQSSHVSGPMTCRIFNPVIIFPKRFTENLSDRELVAIAAHELSHIQRKDMLVLLFVACIWSVLFFQPLLWIAGKEISYLAEHFCDRSALTISGNPVFYADCCSA